MPKRVLSLGFLIACALVGRVYAADQCSDVLVSAAQDVTKIDKTSYSSQKLKNWYCSEQSEKVTDSRNGGFSVGIPIDGVPASIGAKSYDQSMVERRAAFCSDEKRSFSDFESLALLKKVANPAAISAWQECMKPKTPGQEIVALDFSVMDRFIQTVLKFNPPGDGLQQPILDQISVSGASCSGIAVGQKIPIQGLPFICTRDDIKTPVVMLFGTSYGVKTLSLKGDREGTCQVSNTYKKEIWTRQSQAKQTSFDTADLNCRHKCHEWDERSGVNHEYSITVGEDERLIARSVSPATSCSHIPGHDGEGCPFTRIVAGPTYGDKSASVTIRSWGVPVHLTFSVLAEGRSYVPDLKEEGKIEVKGGKTFVILSPKTAEETLVSCKLNDGNEFSFEPSDTESNSFLHRIAINDTGTATSFTYELMAQ